MASDELRERLDRERTRLGEVRASLAEDHLDEESEQENLSDLSANDQHQADIGTETFEREKDMGKQGLEPWSASRSPTRTGAIVCNGRLASGDSRPSAACTSASSRCAARGPPRSSGPGSRSSSRCGPRRTWLRCSAT